MHYAYDLITPVSLNLHISSVITTVYVCGTLYFMQLIVTNDLYCASRLDMLCTATVHLKNIMLDLGLKVWHDEQRALLTYM